VVALDNLRRRGSELNVPRLKAAASTSCTVDVRQASDLEALPCDLLIECSAEPSAQAGYDGAPDYVVETNLLGCYHCLNLARRTKADFIFLSTTGYIRPAILNSLAYRETESRFGVA